MPPVTWLPTSLKNRISAISRQKSRRRIRRSDTTAHQVEFLEQRRLLSAVNMLDDVASVTDCQDDAPPTQLADEDGFLYWSSNESCAIPLERDRVHSMNEPASGLDQDLDGGYYSADPLDDPEVLRKHFDAVKDACEDSADSCDDLGGQQSDVNPQPSETVVVDVSPESHVGFTFPQHPFDNTLLGGFAIRGFGTLGAVGGAARVDAAGNVTALATGHAAAGIRGGQVGGTLHHGPTETGVGATVGTKGINAGASVMGVGAGVRLGGPGVVSVDVDVKVFSFSLGGKPKLTLLGVNIIGD